MPWLDDTKVQVKFVLEGWYGLSPFMRVRQSHLKAFANCARQYYYGHVLGLGTGLVGSLTVFGSVWHFAVDVYENYGNDIDLAKRTFRKYWTNPGLLDLKIDFWHRGSNFQTLTKRGLDMLDRYHELEPWRGGRLIGTEVGFEVPIGDHTLAGTIDKIWVRPQAKTIEVIDFKTGSYVPEKLRFNIQFTAYCYASTQEEFWAQIPGYEDGHVKFYNYRRQGWWYHARNNKMFNAGFREETDYRRLLLTINEMDRAIELGVFPLDYSGESCGYCPFADGVCGSEIKSLNGREI